MSTLSTQLSPRMSSSRLSPRLSRLLALAILAGVAAGTVNLAVLPLLDRWYAANDRLADAAGWRTRLTATVERIPALKKAVDEAELGAAQRSGVLRVENESLGTAEFQKLIQKVMAEAGTQSRSVQALAARREHGMLLLGMRVRAYGDEQALVKLLDTARMQDPALAVRNLNIAAASSGYGEREATQVDMQIDFEILAVEEPK
jgi:Type II secretion system (T2SS), protein M subtype b